MERLQIGEPELYQAYLKAQPTQQQQAALQACQFAIFATHIDNSLTQTALQALAQETAIECQELQALCDQLDERYFELYEEHEQNSPEAESYFFQARAVAALAFALSPSSQGEHLRESLYEALSAISSLEDLAEIKERLLRTLRPLP